MYAVVLLSSEFKKYVNEFGNPVDKQFRLRPVVRQGSRVFILYQRKKDAVQDAILIAGLMSALTGKVCRPSVVKWLADGKVPAIWRIEK